MIYYSLIKKYPEENRRKFEHEAGMELLRRAMWREYGISELPEICFGEYGKPYFKDLRVDFSIAHCDGLAVCIVSRKAVGIDCEILGRASMKAANRYFTQEEKDALRNLQGEERQFLFTELWTSKEAYGKLVGRGLSENLAHISFLNKEYVKGFRLTHYPFVRNNKMYIITSLEGV
ncbi:MAG: 4'-phosphopantetheinyl transferase superfamily protein [Oscillospiraceae bacterium]|nr:4'-phosphopantetheinyl transferase superfamily protein [Oscillospiraceae bacterium]